MAEHWSFRSADIGSLILPDTNQELNIYILKDKDKNKQTKNIQVLMSVGSMRLKKIQ